MHEQEKDNCILALQNIPKGCEVGIDYHSWYVGERFKGISNIPPGFHFVFVRVTDKYGEMAPRSGFFVYMNPGEIISKSFKQDDEEFEPVQANISIDGTNFFYINDHIISIKPWKMRVRFYDGDCIQIQIFFYVSLCQNEAK